IRPVGQTSELPTDVRILSATHKDLGELVAEGSFREDLFYRINVIELHVPPLRERGDDVLMLAHRVLARLAALQEVPAPRLTKAAQAALLGYRFPGNVRELENILERALTLCAGDQIYAEGIQLRPAHEEDGGRGAALIGLSGGGGAAALGQDGARLGTQRE